MKFTTSKLIPSFILAVFCLVVDGNHVFADTVSFLVDAADWDSNNDNFVNGTEFTPTGSDGTVWTITPLVNPGVENLQLDLVDGLRFGGAGNSSWEFSFSPNRDVLLEGYTLTNTPGFTGSADFDLQTLAGGVVSSSNASSPAGQTFSFNSGPFLMAQGSTLKLVVQSPGGGNQSFLSSINYSAVPEPTSAIVLFGLTMVSVLRRRRS